MATRIQLRRDTSSNWILANPVLALGELGLETNTLRLKVGDGLNNWNTLDYISDPAGLAVLKEGDTMTGSLFIETDSVDDSLRITQTGGGNAIVVEDSSTPDTTPFVVKADGKVGIGTTAPNAPLEVNASGNNTVYVRSGDSSIAGIIFGKQSDPETASIQIRHDTNEFRISGFNNSPRISIDSAGRVGIGTITPDSYADLDMRGSVQVASNDPAIFFKESDQGTDEKLWRISTSDGDFNIDTLTDDRTISSTAMKIVRSAAQNIDHIKFSVADDTEVMRITSNGYIGINKAVPDGVLDVRDIASSSNFVIGGANTANIMKIGSGAADSLAIYTNDTNERMRITATGNVGIGTIAPSSLFHIQGADAASTVETIRSIGQGSQTRLQRANGTSASPVSIVTDNEIGSISFQGYAGSTFTEMAKIAAFADDNAGAGDSPSRLEFYTTPDLSGTPLARMVIDSDGLIYGSGRSLGDWTEYTPTITSESGTFTTVSATARYSQIGKTVTVSFAITITTAGTASGQLRFSLPVTAQDVNAVGAAREKAVTGTMCQISGFDTSNAFILTDSNTTIIGNGRLVVGTYIYEAA